MFKPKPLVLCILDGWGYRQDTQFNAIAQANTPNWDRLLTTASCGFLNTSGLAVGLPEGQMGNSEVGHMNIGAGRVVYQELTRISKSIADGDFFDNPVLVQAIDQAVQQDKAVHVMGLLSPGGVHSLDEHIIAALTLAAQRGAKRIYLHAFLDGRDMPPRSAQASIEKIEQTFEQLKVGRIATVVGRYYAMDRDKRWERTQAAYDLLTQGVALHQVDNALAGLAEAYARGENDEFVGATCIGQAVPMVDGDSLLFMNFRADRARQISYPFVDDDFSGFVRATRPKLSHYVCLTHYQDSIQAPVAFKPSNLKNGLGEVLAAHGKTQLRCAETEKYPHVTFFFNGGRETVFEGEDRILVPSPKVATYDLQPEMSAPEVTKQLVNAVNSGLYDVIICNYANPDMVGHTGVFEAVVKAIEAVDTGLGQLVEAVQAAGGELLITADHGNAELTWDEQADQPHTAHTTGPVPLLYVGRQAALRNGGALCDLAPTMLHLLGLAIPPEMTGNSLI